MRLVRGSIHNLEKNNVSSALRKLYQLDNNAYAFMFDEEVYNHFSEYVFEQPKERLKWGYGRLMTHENMYEIITSLLQKKDDNLTDYHPEIRLLREIFRRQNNLLSVTLDEIYQTVTSGFIL